MPSANPGSNAMGRSGARRVRIEELQAGSDDRTDRLSSRGKHGPVRGFCLKCCRVAWTEEVA